MTLQQELSLNTPINSLPREVILNVYYTASCLKKKADEFFGQYGISDVQFNVMMLLRYQQNDLEGLSQAQISQMMLVNRANITSLIDRMEKAGLVVRTPKAHDRRSYLIKLTEKADELMDVVEPMYLSEINRVAVLNENEHRILIKLLERIRENLRNLDFNPRLTTAG